MTKLCSLLAGSALLITLALSAGFTALAPESGAGTQAGDQSQVGQSFRVPYRLTDTNHFLVRVRINGKGPFNFLVDTGAPALYIATETAAQVGLKPVKGEFWTVVDRLELEGGARLPGIKARVEDPFQLVGMNALGLPGASIHGILGFTILARFRMEIDPSRDVMVWTRLKYEPPDPPVPPRAEGNGEGAPAEIRVMNALGPLAKGLAFFMGKQPEEERRPRGFLGLEWAEVNGTAPGQSAVEVRRIMPGSPASKVDIRPGDQIIRAGGRAVSSIKAARSALAELEPGTAVELVVRRGGTNGGNPRERTVTVIAGEGF